MAAITASDSLPVTAAALKDFKLFQIQQVEATLKAVVVPSVWQHTTVPQPMDLEYYLI